MPSSSRNWAHQPKFDTSSMEEFETRLARARTASRPQYLRVKAATLLERGDLTALPVAIALLQRVVADYDHFLEVPFSHELLGRAYRRTGDLSQAETHLKMASETADDRRNGLCLPELELAEVLIEAGRYQEATDQLRKVAELERGMVWNSQLYRHAVANARVAHQTEGNPALWAQRALELASAVDPQLPRHPTVGLVDASPRELDEMRRLVHTEGRHR